jgi:hypothetical protein
MGISLRAFAKHRHCSLFAVQKAIRTGRIPVLGDGTVDVASADRAWDAAAAARRAVEKAPVDATRVKVLPAGVLASAEGSVRATLAQNGVPVGPVLTLGDARMAGELLRIQQQCNALAAQEAEYRVRLRMAADEAIPKHIVDVLITSVVQIITEFVDPPSVPAALDRLKELIARCIPRRTTQ